MTRVTTICATINSSCKLRLRARRASILEDSDELDEAHAAAASADDSNSSAVDANLNNHFITFAHSGGYWWLVLLCLVMLWEISVTWLELLILGKNSQQTFSKGIGMVARASSALQKARLNPAAPAL